MSKYNDIFPQIYAELKDGDGLGFYKKGWLYKLIPLATGGKCQHVGKCYKIRRTKNTITFAFSQQTFEGGKFDDVSFYLTSKGWITDDPYFVKQDRVYYAKLKKPLTPEQIAIGVADAENEVDEKYAFYSLPFGLKLLDKILPNFIKKTISRITKKGERVCSTHFAIQDSKMGLVDYKKDFYWTPIECITQPYYDLF